MFDTSSGSQGEALDLDGDCDDIFFDAESRRLFVACGTGFIDVFGQAPKGLERTARTPSLDGARTAFADAAAHRLFVACPLRGARGAEVREYEVLALTPVPR